MKRSAVALGFRSLTANLHPKAPLSIKESKKLLTVINASFRKHLDEVHPWSGEPQKEQQDLNVLHQKSSASHDNNTSSSALADRHLASVLTSPLFAISGGSHDMTSKLELFKRELSNHPDLDPVVLLQQYGDSTASSIPIASWCLETVRQSLRKLDPGARHATAVKLQAGQRTLRCLQQSKLYGALNVSQVESRRLLLALVRTLSFEGNDELIWNTMILNLKSSVAVSNHLEHERNIERQKHMSFTQNEHDHRKFMLFALIKAKLPHQSGSMNAALDVFSKACDLDEPLLPRQFLLPAARLLVKEIRNGTPASHAVEEMHYDKFIQQYSAHVSEIDLWKSFDESSLRLFHPTKPSAKQAATSLLSVFGPDHGVDSRGILAHFGSPNTQSTQLVFFAYVSKVVAKLQEEADLTTASGLMTKLAQKFPAFVDAPSYEALSRRQCELQMTTTPTEASNAAQNTGVLPFATFGHFASDH